MGPEKIVFLDDSEICYKVGLRMTEPRILAEEKDLGLLLLYKPAGYHVFGSSSIASWLCSRRQDLCGVGSEAEPALVHRLDQKTSGIMLAATHQRSYTVLREAFEQKKIHKVYLALTHGLVDQAQRITVPLGGRYRRSRKVKPVLSRTRKYHFVQSAQSDVEPLAMSSEHDLTLCKVVIKTGVRHQIRAHLAHIGHPLVGDALYGAQKNPYAPLTDRFFLHAWKLGFSNIFDGLERLWACPLPRALQELLDLYRFQRSRHRQVRCYLKHSE